MTYEELEILVKNDEHRQLELKKTTGELKDGMHSACAFLNTEGGWLMTLQETSAPKSAMWLFNTDSSTTTAAYESLKTAAGA